MAQMTLEEVSAGCHALGASLGQVDMGYISTLFEEGWLVNSANINFNPEVPRWLFYTGCVDEIYAAVVARSTYLQNKRTGNPGTMSWYFDPADPVQVMKRYGDGVANYSPALAARGSCPS